MVGVMVVDEDEIQRRGLDASLAADGIAVVPSPPAAPGPPPEVVIAAVHCAVERWDHMEAIEALARVRRHHPRCRLIALVDSIPHPLVRLRLASAGVDELIARREVCSAADLGELARGERVGESPDPMAIEMATASLPAGADPAQVLDLVRTEGLTGVFSETGTGDELSRRGRITLRKRIALAGNLVRGLSANTGGPPRKATVPTWREVTSFVQAARGCGQSCRCRARGIEQLSGALV